MQLAALQQYLLDRLEELMPEPERRHPIRERYILDGDEVTARLAGLGTKQAIVRGLQGASIRLR